MCHYGIIIAEMMTPDWDAIDMSAAISCLDKSNSPIEQRQKVFVISPGFSPKDEEQLLALESIIGYDKRPESKDEFLALVKRCLSQPEVKSGGKEGQGQL